MNFAVFRGAYPLRKPVASCIKNQGELVLIPEGQGRLRFPQDASSGVVFSSIPRSYADRGQLYLWVVAANDVPFALENAPFGQDLETGKIKHTNLTGGKEAHCGGELWFLSEKKLLLSAASGRYGPQSKQEMTDVALAFKSEGFEVASLGFDEETGYPCTVLVGEPKWI